MAELRVEVEAKESSKTKLVRSTCAGRVGKMGDENLAKRAYAQKMEGKWRRGRSKLRWGIALKVI